MLTKFSSLLIVIGVVIAWTGEARAADSTIRIVSPMTPPTWAVLEREFGGCSIEDLAGTTGPTWLRRRRMSAKSAVQAPFALAFKPTRWLIPSRPLRSPP